MADEPRTDDLLERLLKSASPEAYLKEQLLDEKSFAYYANELPKRNKVIMLAFGLHCDLTETQRLLRRAGHAELWSKVERDAIIIHCIQHGRTRLQTDDELFRLGYETLVSEEG